MQKLSRWVAFLVAVILVFSVGLSLAEEDVPNASGSTLKLPASLTTVGVQAFYGDKALVDVVLPDSVKRIESKAFANSSVQTITLPAGITYIADDAFTNCSNLVATVTKGSYAMQYCEDHSIAYVLEGAKKNYRALLIGVKTFLRYWDLETADRNEGDVNNMAAMLSSVYGNDGISRFKVTKKIDLSYSGIKSAIQSTFKDTTDSDVSLFFIASHGNSGGDGELEIAFTGDPDNYDDVYSYYDYSMLSFPTLASWLTQYVKGEVIVILESCGAGSAIYISDEEQNAIPLPNDGDDSGDDSAAIAEAAVRAFRLADPGVPAETPDGTEDDDPDLHATGELRLPKYYVLACSRHQELSWGNSYANYFTNWLIEGVGSADNSPADTSPKDKAVTLTELFNYIKTYDDYAFTVYEDGGYVSYYQHVQRYPVGSKYELFRFK